MNPQTRGAEPLFPIPAVHCFFGCGHVVRGVSADGNHARMEDHYGVVHADQLARLVAAVAPQGAS